MRRKGSIGRSAVFLHKCEEGVERRWRGQCTSWRGVAWLGVGWSSAAPSHRHRNAIHTQALLTIKSVGRQFAPCLCFVPHQARNTGQACGCLRLAAARCGTRRPACLCAMQCAHAQRQRSPVRSPVRMRRDSAAQCAAPCACAETAHPSAQAQAQARRTAH